MRKFGIKAKTGILIILLLAATAFCLVFSKSTEKVEAEASSMGYMAEFKYDYLYRVGIFDHKEIHDTRTNGEILGTNGQGRFYSSLYILSNKTPGSGSHFVKDDIFSGDNITITITGMSGSICRDHIKNAYIKNLDTDEFIVSDAKEAVTKGDNSPMYSGKLNDGHYRVYISTYYYYVIEFIASITYDFYIDSTAPTITTGIGDKDYTKNDVTVSISESNTGAGGAGLCADNDYIWLKYNRSTSGWPTSASSTIYNQHKFKDSGYYLVTATDKAGNMSKKYFSVDKTAPKLSPSGGNQTYMNTPVSCTITDTYSGLKSQEYLKDGEDEWKSYTDQFFSDDGKYYFRAVDKAGNKSGYDNSVWVVYDNTKPIASFIRSDYGDNITGNYTRNNFNWSVKKEPYNASLSIKYRKDRGEWKDYKGDTISKEGYYEFQATDSAGNETTAEMTLDKTAPQHPTLSEAYTNRAISFVPSDNTVIDKLYYYHGRYNSLLEQEFEVASGKSFAVAATPENNGEWWFYAKDVAGNVSEPQRVTMNVLDTFGNKEKIKSGYKVTSWYNVTLPSSIFSIEGKSDAGTYSFPDYAAALSFAMKKEKEYRVNAIPGGWVYISANNESVAQVYSDQNALESVVEKYAKKYIGKEQKFINGKNNYYQEANSPLVRQELPMPSYLKNAYGKLPLYYVQHDYQFSEPAFYYNNQQYTVPVNLTLQLIGDDTRLLTGNREFDLSYNIKLVSELVRSGFYKQGYFIVTESDAAGNNEQYIVYLDLSPPTLTANAVIGDGSIKTIEYTKEYLEENEGLMYYCGLKELSLSDGEDGYYALKITGKGFSSGGEIFLSGESLPDLVGEDYSGQYLIEVYDRSLNTLRFNFILAAAEPKLVAAGLGSDTEARLMIQLSDSYNSIVDLHLYKIDANGEYHELTEDDNGLEVSPLNLTYVLKNGGKYTARFTDRFGRTIEAAPVFFTKGLPYGQLSGVNNGGITNKNVSLTFGAGAELEVYLWQPNGAKKLLYSGIDYTLTFAANRQQYTATIEATALNNGEYMFFLFNENDRNLFVEYCFEIDTIVAQVTAYDTGGDVIEHNGSTTKPFRLSWSESVSIYYYTSLTVGGSLGQIKYNQGTVLSQDAVYYFSVKDSVGNVDEFSILLDTVVNFSLTGNYTLVSPNSYISNGAVTVTVLESFRSFIVTNEDGYIIENGGTLTRDGIYTIYVTDNYGNSVTLTIEIDTTPPAVTLENVENGGVANGSVSVDFTDFSKAYLTDAKGNTIVELIGGEQFSEHGNYYIEARDRAGNIAKASFRIDKAVDYTASVPSAGITSGKVSIEFLEEVEITATLNGEPYDIPKLEATFFLEGHYEICAVDLAGNVLNYSFDIIPNRTRSLTLKLSNDWSLSGATRDGELALPNITQNEIVVDAAGLWELTFLNRNGESFTLAVEVDNIAPTVELIQKENAVSIESVSKPGVTYKLYKNGAEVTGYKGGKITGNGSYKLVVFDDLGNENVYEFKITYKLNAASIAIIAIGTATVLAALILIIRSKRKIKVK